MKECCKNCWYWWREVTSNMCHCEDSDRYGENTRSWDECPWWKEKEYED